MAFDASFMSDFKMGLEEFREEFNKAEDDLKKFIESRSDKDRDFDLTEIGAMYCAVFHAGSLLKFLLKKKGMKDEDIEHMDMILGSMVQQRFERTINALEKSS